MRSVEAALPAAEGRGWATDDPRDPTTGRAVEVTAAEELEVSLPPSPNKCWMECSWKQGSESRTDAAREILSRIRVERERKRTKC